MSASGSAAIEGERIHAPPAELHAAENLDLGYPPRARVAPGYRAAVSATEIAGDE